MASLGNEETTVAEGTVEEQRIEDTAVEGTKKDEVTKEGASTSQEEKEEEEEGEGKEGKNDEDIVEIEQPRSEENGEESIEDEKDVVSIDSSSVKKGKDDKRREILLTKEQHDTLAEMRQEAEGLLSGDSPKALYNLPLEHRQRVAKYSRELFNWFVSLPSATLFVGIPYLTDVKVPFPIEPPKPVLFSLDLCPRVADFWRQSKDLSKMASHFHKDEPSVMLCLLFHAFQNPGYDPDVSPLLRRKSIDHNIYNLVTKFLAIEATKMTKEESDKKTREKKEKKRGGETRNGDEGGGEERENEDECGVDYSEEQEPPMAAVCYTLLSPSALVVALYLAWVEANGGKDARVRWEDLKIESQEVTIEEFLKYDKIIMESAETMCADSVAEDAAMMKQLDDIEAQLTAMMGETEALVAQSKSMNAADVEGLKRRAREVKAGRTIAIDDILPADFEEQTELQRKELEAVEQDVAVLEVAVKQPLDFDGKSRLEKRDVELPEGERVFARHENFARTTFQPAMLMKMLGEKCLVRFDGQSIDTLVSMDDVASMSIKVPMLSEGVRVAAMAMNIALPNSSPALYSGTIASRIDLQSRQYLIFFDDGFESYATRGSEVFVLLRQPFGLDGGFYKENCHMLITPNHRETIYIDRKRFLHNYFRRYPDWQLVRMKKQKGQRVSVYSRDGQPWSAFVIDVDRAMCTLRFNPLKAEPAIANCFESPCRKHHHSEELVYRGSPRLSQLKQPELTMNLDGTTAATPGGRRHRRHAQTTIAFESAVPDYGTFDDALVLAGQKNTMRKTGQRITQESAIDRRPMIMEIQKQREKKRFESELQIEHHRVEMQHYSVQNFHVECSHECLQGMDRDPANSMFATVSPFFIPTKCGWRRFIQYYASDNLSNKGVNEMVYYRAPCGKPCMTLEDVVSYIEDTRSELVIDLFTFDPQVDDTKYAVLDERYRIMEDFTQGREMKPLPVVNEVDKDPAPQFLYNARRYPVTQEVDLLAINKHFCSGCTCEDNCRDPKRCECQKLTRDMGQRLAKSLRLDGHGRYKYRRLENKILSGIYECNDNCHCNRKRCFNRVVQLDIKIPMQMMKTPAMGWGVRTLVDLPKGTFICNYNGALLTDEIAEKWEEGDEYFADLDLMHVVETEKRNAGIDILEDYGIGQDVESSSEDEADKEDDDYKASHEASEPGEEGGEGGEQVERGEGDETTDGEVDFIDEDIGSEGGEEKGEEDTEEKKSEVFEKQDATVAVQEIDNDEAVGGMEGPAGRVTPEDRPASAGMMMDEVEKYAFERYFETAKRSTLYIVDAKSQGNVGRFLNHSCDPNVMVQHVMVDTHDLRLPWVSFFTSRFVPAGEELFWDYGWQPTEGHRRHLKCQCGSENCRGELL